MFDYHVSNNDSNLKRVALSVKYKLSVVENKTYLELMIFKLNLKSVISEH